MAILMAIEVFVGLVVVLAMLDEVAIRLRCVSVLLSWRWNYVCVWGFVRCVYM
jgi:hypothetical protein